MFAWIRRLIVALERAASSLERLADGSQEANQVAERVSALERGIEVAHAEAEAKLIKAESRFAAARAAEERARHREDKLAARAGEGDPGFTEDEIRDAYAEAGFPLGDAPGSESEGVQPMHEALGRRASERAPAYAMKWGRR